MINEYVTYQGKNYQIVRIWTWGSVEFATLRPVGYNHTVNIALVNLDV